jgi:hypothetical protein
MSDRYAFLLGFPVEPTLRAKAHFGDVWVFLKIDLLVWAGGGVSQINTQISSQHGKCGFQHLFLAEIHESTRETQRML